MFNLGLFNFSSENSDSRTYTTNNTTNNTINNTTNYITLQTIIIAQQITSVVLATIILSSPTRL
jgi:hypothetical protein